MTEGLARQLVFDLARKPRLDKDDFLVSSANEAAVTAIRGWRDWPGRTLLLIGAPGSGKTHLATIWADNVDASIATRGDVPISSGQSKGGRILLEDCDRTALSETDVFHLINAAREMGAWLLMTSRSSPSAWNMTIADLRSRLRLSTTVTIEPPDDQLMKAVLVKLFADRQLKVDEEVISYAARHCERSLFAANKFVSAVDEVSLSISRSVTRPLAVATIARLRQEDDDAENTA